MPKGAGAEGMNAEPAKAGAMVPALCHSANILPLTGLGILVAALVWQFVRYLIYLKLAVFYPYSLDYGEGIVWQQMRDMVDGTAYVPLRVFPAIVYHYPPVYHLTSSLLAAITGMDQLVAGRTVSLVSTFATAVMVGMLALQVMPLQTDVRIRRICAILAGLLFLTCYPVLSWSIFMRVDMLSGALALGGMLLAVRALDRPAWIYGAALMFLLSVYAKQVSIAAPMAAFFIVLLIKPKVAIRGIVVSVVGGLSALTWLSWATNGGFITHIFVYNLNRFLPEAFAGIFLPQILLHTMLIMLSIMGAGAGFWQIRAVLPGRFSLRTASEALGQNRVAAVTLMLLIFFMLKSVMLGGILKSGATVNYMIEWFVPVAVFAATAVMPLVAWALGDPSRTPKFPPLLVFLAFAGLPVQLILMPTQFDSARDLLKREAEGRQIVKLIASSSRPVISDDMTFTIRAGKKVEWESAIAAELGALGQYDQPAFVDLIRSHCFGFFVIEGPTDFPEAMARYNLSVAQAILSAYPVRASIDKFSIFSPSAAFTSKGHCLAVPAPVETGVD